MFSSQSNIFFKVPRMVWNYGTKNLKILPEITYLSAKNFSLQKLPKLPVPPLQQTLQKYLRSVKPLVSEDEFKETQEIVKKFGSPDGEGEKLQKALVERAKKHENWFTDWWVDVAYLRFRWPVVVWSSPGLVMPLREFKSLDDQINYAAVTIAGAIDYKSLIDNNKVPMEYMGKNPVDMSQYYNIFGTCRMPGITCDAIEYGHKYQHPTKHVIVMHNNHFFKLDVYDKNDKPLTSQQLASQIRNIIERSTHPTTPLGILTSQNRNVWGKAHKMLKKDKINSETLSIIQKALFVVCIDGPIASPTGNKMNDAALLCIHGNDVNGNSGNRFFDKTLQFIIGKKGEVGITYEHSPAEGGPIANLMDYVVNYISKHENVKKLSADELPKPERLQFNVSSEIESEIANAQSTLQSLIDDLEMTCFTFDSFGKDFIKSQKLSPDSFIQMAIQYAFYRIHKLPGAHYESGSTRMFLHGRTETIRSCSIESVAFAKTMLDANSTLAEKANALKTAIDGHKKFAFEALTGHGIDRHLLGLKLAAVEAGMNVPSLFMDVSYSRSTHMRLSTSQVPAKCESFMCYGPLVPNGYGCCYNPRDKSIEFGTSALNSSPETQSSVFAKALQDSLMEMHDVLVENSLKAKL